MAGVRKKALATGKYQGNYVDGTGKRKFFTGTRNRAETKRMAERLEDEHRQVRLGYRPAPTSAHKNRSRPFDKVTDEYLKWGATQGGWKGRPWSGIHSRRRKSILSWWEERLGFETLADLEGVLPRIEKALRDLETEGRAGKTLRNYAEAIKAFCNWCVDRGYLANDPLKALAPFDTTPKSRRRAMTPDEIRGLLSACRPQHKLLYETALFSGLRVNELKNLTVDHLDVERGGLHLDAEWTKNRQPGFQPLPRDLIERLQTFAATGEVQRIYDANFQKAKAKKQPPRRPLLYVPSHTALCLDSDLEDAGIPKHTPKGKLDFHALRTSYINLVLDGDTSVRDSQALARHSTAELTLNVYGRPREERLSEAVEQIAERVLFEEKRAISVQRLAVGAEIESATPFEIESCASERLIAAEGFEPPTHGL